MLARRRRKGSRGSPATSRPNSLRSTASQSSIRGREALRMPIFMQTDQTGTSRRERSQIQTTTSSEQQARAFAAEIANPMGQAYPGDETGAAGVNQALGRMTGAFLRNGPQDLQRHPQW